MTLETHLQEGERALAHFWKVTALRGALAIAFAVVVLIWPSIGLSALVALFGALRARLGSRDDRWRVQPADERR